MKASIARVSWFCMGALLGFSISMAFTLRGRCEFLVSNSVIGEDADLTCDLHGFFGDSARRQLGIVHEGARRRESIRSAAPDGCDPFIGLDYISRTTDEKCLAGIGDDQQRLEIAKNLVGSPVLREFHCGAAEVSVILL